MSTKESVDCRLEDRSRRWKFEKNQWNLTMQNEVLCFSEKTKWLGCEFLQWFLASTNFTNRKKKKVFLEVRVTVLVLSTIWNSMKFTYCVLKDQNNLIGIYLKVCLNNYFLLFMHLWLLFFFLTSIVVMFQTS